MSIDFKWENLDRAKLPAGQHPKTWPAWGLPRADGREVAMESMFQFYIYEGDLLGAMQHPSDRLGRVVKRAKEMHPWIKAEPVVVPPVLLQYEAPVIARLPISPEVGIGPVTLPRIAVVALLRSHREARDRACCFSSLIVIWFQETFGDASPDVLSQIARIDWEAKAFDWMP